MIRFITTNEFLSATVSDSGTASGFDSDDILTLKPKEAWRSSSTTNQWIKFDLGSATNIDSLAVFGLNLSSSATVTVYANDTDLGSSLATWQSSAALNSANTLTSDGYLAAIFFDTNQNYQFWLIEFDDASNADGYIQVGHVWGGDHVAPTENFTENFNEILTDSSLVNQSDGLHIYSVVKERAKRFEISFNAVTEANRDTLFNIWSSVYRTEPFLVALDPTDNPAIYTRMVQFENDISFAHVPFNRFSTAFTLREVR